MSENLLVDRRPDGTTFLLLIGRLDADSAPQVEEWIDAGLVKRPWRIVFNLERLSDVSSTGVRILLKTRKIMTERGGKTLVLNPQPQVKRVFDVLHVLNVNEMFESVADLDAYLDSIQTELPPIKYIGAKAGTNAETGASDYPAPLPPKKTAH